MVHGDRAHMEFAPAITRELGSPQTSGGDGRGRMAGGQPRRAPPSTQQRASTDSGTRAAAVPLQGAPKSTGQPDLALLEAPVPRALGLRTGRGARTRFPGTHGQGGSRDPAPRRGKRGRLLKTSGLSAAARLYLQFTFPGDTPGCGEELAGLHSPVSQTTHCSQWKRTV